MLTLLIKLEILVLEILKSLQMENIYVVNIYNSKLYFIDTTQRLTGVEVRFQRVAVMTQMIVGRGCSKI